MPSQKGRVRSAFRRWRPADRSARFLALLRQSAGTADSIAADMNPRGLKGSMEMNPRGQKGSMEAYLNMTAWMIFHLQP